MTRAAVQSLCDEFNLHRVVLGGREYENMIEQICAAMHAEQGHD